MQQIFIVHLTALANHILSKGDENDSGKQEKYFVEMGFSLSNKKRNMKNSPQDIRYSILQQLLPIHITTYSMGTS